MAYSLDLLLEIAPLVAVVLDCRSAIALWCPKLAFVTNSEHYKWLDRQVMGIWTPRVDGSFKQNRNRELETDFYCRSTGEGDLDQERRHDVFFKVRAGAAREKRWKQWQR